MKQNGWVERSMNLHNHLFCAHALCMGDVTYTLLLVSSSVRIKQLLCFVHGQGQKSEQKPTTKNFAGFHNHSPLLTMIRTTNCFFFGCNARNKTKNILPKLIIERCVLVAHLLDNLKIFMSSWTSMPYTRVIHY